MWGRGVDLQIFCQNCWNVTCCCYCHEGGDCLCGTVADNRSIVCPAGDCNSIFVLIRVQDIAMYSSDPK
jgi:hypothetical protein